MKDRRTKDLPIRAKQINRERTELGLSCLDRPPVGTRSRQAARPGFRRTGRVAKLWRAPKSRSYFKRRLRRSRSEERLRSPSSQPP